MNVLVLNRIPLRHLPYATLLPDARVFLISLATAVGPETDLGGYARVETVVDYERSGRVEELALAWHREAPFDRIVAVSEFDLLRAGKLRDLLGVEGQSYDSALAFRDKVRMKEIARAGGVRVPAFRRVETPLDLLTFVQDHGLGVVLKPILGAGSVSTHLIRTPDDLERVLRSPVFAPGEVPSPLEVESLIAGPMYHVDGHVQDGRIVAMWPSAYVYPCHTFASGTVHGSHTLAIDNPLAERLCGFVDRLLAVLPTPTTTGFHAEVFHTPEDDLVLCEVASRIGGPRIPDLFRVATGFDLLTSLVRGLGGHPIAIPESPVRPIGVAGDLNVPARTGVLEHAPERCEVPGVLDYRLTGEVGARHEASVDLTDFVATFLYRRDTEEQARATLHEAAAWFDRECVWSAA